jgi:prepilin-type N-terminal cleavage/methylation domain-containing protein
MNSTKITIRQDNGFTLIELMIVVAIIGILAATGFATYKDYTLKSVWSTNVASIEQIKTAAAQCMIDNQNNGTSCDTVLQLNSYGFAGSAFPIPPNALNTPISVSGSTGTPGKITITFTGNAKAGSFVYKADCSPNAGGNFECISVAGDTLPANSGWVSSGSVGAGNRR